MKEMIDISSGFDEDNDFQRGTEYLDLSKARKISTSGTTCEAFETRYHSRRVFVKKLKKEFQSSDRYREAFRKEYETGINLSHPSLPVYTEFFGDAIVMNYINGRTLADMISKKDSWLTNESNIKKLLDQLIEVIEYLHRHNIVHSDIKADNVIVTYHTHNVFLIDFDKCYTDWLDTTPGSTELYGLSKDSTGNPEIDFRGLGRIAEKLIFLQKSSDFKKTLKRFANACSQENTSVDHLKKIIEVKDTNIHSGKNNLSLKNKYIMGGIGVVVLLLLSFGLPAIIFSDSTVSVNGADKSSEITHGNEDSIREVSSVPMVSETTVKEVSQLPTDTPDTPNSATFPSETEINRELKIIFKPLDEKINQAKSQFLDSTYTYDSKLDVMFELGELQSELTHRAYSFFERKYPDANSSDIQMAVGSSKVFQDVIKELSQISGSLIESSNSD